MSNIECLIDGEGIRARRHSHTGPPGIGMLPRGTRYRSSPEAKAPLQPHDDVPGQGPREQHEADTYIVRPHDLGSIQKPRILPKREPTTHTILEGGKHLLV